MKWTVTGPDGQQYRGVEADSADEAKRIVQQRQPRAVGTPGHSGARTTEAPQDFGSTPANLAAGFGQGLLDPLEGMGQMAEHLPLVGGAVRAVIPDALRNWAKNYQSRVGASGTAGSIGEFAGNVAPFLGLLPETGVAEAVSQIPRIGKALGFLGRTALPATLEPTQSQPTRDPITGKTEAPTPFWEQKGEQAALGTAIGGPLEGIAAALGRVGRGARAKTAAANQAQQTAATAAQQTAATHAAAVTAHQDATLQRAAEKVARDKAITARDAIPNETTLRWQKATLDRIGLGDQAPTAVTPEGSARVQKLVGDRINSIMGRMHLDPSDPGFTEQINDIRDTTHGQLPESAQTRFYKEPPEEEEKPLLYHPTTGKPLERTTRGLREKEPPKPTGDWQRTVVEPLAKGPLTQRGLTDYVSRLGARAEELAREARTVPQDKRSELYAMSNAYRQVADAVIGHAAGDPQDKLALGAAHDAYRMWSIGNDAGRASKGGVMAPGDLVRTLSRRMGEARYKSALAGPQSADRDLYQYLQGQLQRQGEKPPKVTTTVPRHPGKLPGTPATPADHISLPAVLAGHAALAHIPGNHLLPWGTRHPLARGIGGYLSRVARPVTKRLTGNVPRRLSAPASAGASNIVKQTEEPDMSYSAPPGFGPPR